MSCARARRVTWARRRCGRGSLRKCFLRPNDAAGRASSPCKTITTCSIVRRNGRGSPCAGPKETPRYPGARASAAMSTQSHAARRQDSNEERLEMPLVRILGHVRGNRRLALFQQVQITVTHFGGDLVADVQQLPQIRIECRAVRVVAQCIGEL